MVFLRDGGTTSTGVEAECSRCLGPMGSAYWSGDETTVQAAIYKYGELELNSLTRAPVTIDRKAECDGQLNT